jgi:RHS repeat-associated protein
VEVLSYDGRGLPLRKRDENGTQTGYCYDGLGRLMGYTMNHGGSSPSPISISIGYDASNNVVSMTDGKENTSTWSYDEQSRLAEEDLCGGDNTTIDYNDLGLPTLTTDTKGALVTCQYDQHGLLTHKGVSFASGSLQTTFEDFEYDGAYRLAFAKDDDTEVRFEYALLTGDLLLERLKIQNREEQTTSYDWDDTGKRLEHLTYPRGRGTWDYSYDELDRVKEISRAGVKKVAYWYEGPGERLVRREKGESITQATKIVSSYAYDALKRLTGLTHQRKPAGSTIRSLSYQWGNGTSGKIFERSREYLYDGISYITKTYEYDNAYRLTRAWHNTQCWTYAYDAAQSRTSYTGPGGYASYSINNENQVTGETGYPGGTLNYSYDGAGNRISKTNQIYGYDYRNQLVSVSDASASPTVAWSFRYDALGRRVSEERVKGASTTTRLFYYAGQEIIVETDGSHVVQRESVFGVGVDSVEWTSAGAGERFPLEDSLGSVVAVVNNSGAVMTSFTYTPYGEATRTGESYPYAFTGRRSNEELKLYDYRSRFYDPKLGRFLQRDTIGIWGDGVGLGNGYAYVGNNPVNRIDPWGLGFWTRVGGALQAGFGLIEAGVGAASAASTGGWAAVPGYYAMVDGAANAAAGWRTFWYDTPTQTPTEAVVSAGLQAVGVDKATSDGLAAGTSAGVGASATAKAAKALQGAEKAANAGKAATEGAEEAEECITKSGDKLIDDAADAAQDVAKAGQAAPEGGIVNRGGRFADLDKERQSGEVAHHTPQNAYNRTEGLSRADGPAVGMTTADHALTRTFAGRGAETMRLDAELNARQRMARDILDLRANFGRRYNEGSLDAIEYAKALLQFKK